MRKIFEFIQPIIIIICVIMAFAIVISFFSSPVELSSYELEQLKKAKQDQDIEEKKKDIRLFENKIL